MTIPGALPPIAQMGHVEKLADVEQNHPAVQQSVAQSIAREELHRQNSQVPQVDVSDRSRKVGDRKAGREKGRREDNRRAAADTEKETEDGPDPSGVGSTPNPFAGKIVDVKI